MVVVLAAVVVQPDHGADEYRTERARERHGRHLSNFTFDALALI